MHKGSVWIPIVWILAGIAGLLVVISVYVANPLNLNEAQGTTNTSKQQSGSNSVANQNVDETGTNSGVNTNTTTDSTAAATSYGLWFPYNNGITINNATPVIWGKVSQRDATYVATTFTDLEWPHRDFGQAKSLTYLSGKVRGLDVMLDGTSVGDVYGIPQFPSIACYSYQDDPVRGQIPVPYATEADCRAAFQDRLPALIFVFRPTSALAEGRHRLQVGDTQMEFTISSSATLATQTQLPATSKANFGDIFDMVDNCPTGYYQGLNDFPFALPKLKNANLFYGLSFPQSESEKGSIQRRHVELALGGSQYPVFFPDAPTFWEGKLIGTGSGRGDFGLYLPLDHLVYADGKPATVWKIYGGLPNYTSPTSYYTEEYIIDTLGRVYRGRQLPWEMSGSSGCDG